MQKIEANESFYARSRHAWRNWLKKNHLSQKSIWLILYNKGSVTPTLTYEEAVEEALCFGWIDSIARKRDAESRFQFFAQRNPKSNWSRPNRIRAERLIAEGKMTPRGKQLIDLAKQSGTWDALADAENAVIPPDLQARFNKNKKALENFQAFSNSSKRIILEWIMNAKRPETRLKRIEETVKLAAMNIRANHPKP